MPPIALAAVLAAAFCLPLGAQSAAQPLAEPSAQPPAQAVTAQDPQGLIGMSPSEAYAALGAPAEVFPYRGTEDWQDDVVFYYPSHLYLFWYRNRVWQVRADDRFGGEFVGLRMGAAREEVVAAVGRQYQEVGESLVFFLPDASTQPGADGRSRGGYPVRLRAFFQDGKLVDAYLYRGDF